MYQLCLKSRQYLSFRQVWICMLLLWGQAASAQSRMPASYIPDDDVIVKPVDNELSFYQQYVASDKSVDVVSSRNQIKIWNENQIFAEQYGLDSTLTGSAFFVPTPDEKFDYFKEKYMRYLRRKGEQPLKDTPKNWYQSYRASNEIDTIDEMEERFKETSQKTISGKELPDSLKEKEVSVWKKSKFIFQPRLDQGLVIVGFKSPIAYARAWVGINGKTEVNVQQTYDQIGLRLMFNYYADSGRYFSSADQHIMGGLSARVTSQQDPATDFKDNSYMLLYTKQF